MMCFDSLYRDLSRRIDSLDLDELLINGSRAMMEIKGQQVNRCDSPFEKSEDMLEWCFTLAGKSHARLDFVSPSSGGLTEDRKYRWHTVLTPISGDDVILSLRKLRFDGITTAQFSDPRSVLPHLQNAILENIPVIICGLPGSGKSTLMSALLQENCSDQRTVILEQVPEINHLSDHWFKLCARSADTEGDGLMSMEQLFSEALRLRPDRIVIGEIRGQEIMSFYQAMDCFPKKPIATMHGGDCRAAAQRFLSLGRQYAAGYLRDQEIGFCLVERGSPPGVVDIQKIKI